MVYISAVGMERKFGIPAMSAADVFVVMHLLQLPLKKIIILYCCNPWGGSDTTPKVPRNILKKKFFATEKMKQFMMLR